MGLFFEKCIPTPRAALQTSSAGIRREGVVGDLELRWSENFGLVHRFDEIDHMGVGFIFAETTCSLTA
jgi:hypothetical protein